jgi:hypothetical protein
VAEADFGGNPTTVVAPKLAVVGPGVRDPRGFRPGGGSVLRFVRAFEIDIGVFRDSLASYVFDLRPIARLDSALPRAQQLHESTGES